MYRNVYPVYHLAPLTKRGSLPKFPWKESTGVGIPTRPVVKSALVRFSQKETLRQEFKCK